MNLVMKTINKLKETRDPSVQTSAGYRLLLVIKARWLMLGLLLIHGLPGIITHAIANNSGNSPITIQYIYEQSKDMTYIPILLVLSALVYNSGYHIGWYKWTKIWQPRVNQSIIIQLVTDILFVLLLIHTTGGVTSWLWPLLLLINIELAFLLSANWTILAVGSLINIGYSALAFLEYNRIIGTYQTPYYQANLQYDLPYVILITIWVNLICAFSLFTGLFLLKNEHMQLKDRIDRDGLTNLYNRRYFNYRLNSEIKRAQRYKRVVSLILFDIDNFKNYNDTYGHVQGDILLRWIADISKLNIRRSDEYEIDIPCRYGGEEMAIILPETDAEANLRTAEKDGYDIETQTSGAISVAERIRVAVEKSTALNGAGVTISIGIACFPTDGKDERTIIEAADEALYLAKTTGKNRTIVANQSKNLSKQTTSVS